VMLPGGLGGIFLWNEKQKALVPGRQDFEL
jgi:hypothetical protein